MRFDKARRDIANRLALLARRIYPKSEEVISFYADRMVEVAITGQSVIKMTAVDQKEYQHVVYPTSTITDPEMKKVLEDALERSTRRLP